MASRAGMITSQYLLEGAWYALEQCAFLLRDAGILYRRKSYASAIALTAFAWEEFGRSRILRDLRKEIFKGKTVTLEDIRQKCDDHVTKQSKAMVSTVQRASGNLGFAKLLRATMPVDPQSEEYKQAREQLKNITERQRKRTPDDRHLQRENALYVDPLDSGLGWNKPKEIYQEKARAFIEDAVNDYAGEWDRLQCFGPSILQAMSADSHQSFSAEFLQAIDIEFLQASQAWNDCPELPEPPRDYIEPLGV
jgi:AbiV family abortive infection protein